MNRKLSVMLMMMFLFCHVFNVHGTNYHAVCIGISDYPGTDDDISDDTVSDAEDMRSFLMTYQGWSSSNIELITNSSATESNITTQIGNMPNSTGNSELFFYSGHGETGGLKTYSGTISPTELKNAFGSSFNQYCAFLNACNSGVFVTGMSKGEISSACRSNELAYTGGPDDNSIYSYYVLEGIENDNADPTSGHVVSAYEIHDYADGRTTNYATQYKYSMHPQFKGNLGVLNLSSLGPTNSGTLVDSELWDQNVTLAGNVTIPDGEVLAIYNSTINLNGYYIKCQGSGKIVKTGSATINPKDIPVISGTDIKGQYSSVEQALSNASSGQTINPAASTYSESNNLTVSTGVTLQLSAGTTFQMASGKKITVNGILSATGSYNNEITFEAQSGTWYGIEVNSTGHFNPMYCSFEDAQYPIRYYNSDGSVEHCDFTGYTRAVKYDNYSDSWITYSTFIEYGGTGIEYTQYSGGDIRSYNQIQDNYYGIKIDNTSSPDAGTYAGQGYNSIYNVMYDVYSTNSSSISAQYNYWGGGDPSIYGNVTWEPALDEDPTLSKRFVRAAVEPEAVAVTSYADTVGFKEFDRAHLLYLQGKTEQALALFRELTDRYPDYNVGRQSLAFEYRILRKEKRESESESRMLTVSETYEGKEISALARSIRVAQLLKDGDYSQAVTIAEDIVAKFPNTNLEKYSLYDLGTIHWYYLNDRQTGEKYYRQLIAEYPKDDLSISALATMGEWVSPDSNEKEQKNVGKLVVSDGVPEKYDLQQNYPNPFNPITTIEYDVPEESEVTISIYNIQGRLVANLVNEHQKPGHHYITWHAGNQPSGMYLYKMEADHFSAVRKLMLIK